MFLGVPLSAEESMNGPARFPDQNPCKRERAAAEARLARDVNLVSCPLVCIPSP